MLYCSSSAGEPHDPHDDQDDHEYPDDADTSYGCKHAFLLSQLFGWVRVEYVFLMHIRSLSKGDSVPVSSITRPEFRHRLHERQLDQIDHDRCDAIRAVNGADPMMPPHGGQALARLVRLSDRRLGSGMREP